MEVAGTNEHNIADSGHRYRGISLDIRPVAQLTVIVISPGKNRTIGAYSQAGIHSCSNCNNAADLLYYAGRTADGP